MQVYINSKKSNIDAIGEFNINTRELLVLKGSKVSDSIAYSEKFRGAKSIEKQRNGKIKNNILIENISFKSPSTAANFVTGRSTNGLIAWKNKEGKTIKIILNEG